MWWKARAPNTIRLPWASRRGAWQIGYTEWAATATSNVGRDGGGTVSPEECADKGGRETDAESAKRKGAVRFGLAWRKGMRGESRLLHGEVSS